jgi:hypothetical protein
MKTGWLTTRLWFGMAAYRFAHVSKVTLVWDGGLLAGSRWWTKRFGWNIDLLVGSNGG